MHTAARNGAVADLPTAPTTGNLPGPDVPTGIAAETGLISAVVPTRPLRRPRHHDHAVTSSNIDLPLAHSAAAALTPGPTRLRIWLTAGASVPAPETHGPREGHFWDLLPGGVLVCAVARHIDDGTRDGLPPKAIARAAVKSIRRQTEFRSWPRTEAEWRDICSDACCAARDALDAYGRAHRGRPAADASLLLMLASPDCVCSGGTDHGTTCLLDPDGGVIGLPIGRPGTARRGVRAADPDAVTATMYRGRPSHVALASLGLSPLFLERHLPVPNTGFLAPVLGLIDEAPNEKEARRALYDHLHSSTVTAAIDDDVTLLVAHLV